MINGLVLKGEKASINDVIQIIKKYPSDEILSLLKKMMIPGLYEHTYRKKYFPDIPDELFKYFAAVTAEKAILYGYPHKCCKISPNDFSMLFSTITRYTVSDGIDANDPYKLILRKADSQFFFQRTIFAKHARIIAMFENCIDETNKVLREIKKPEFDFKQKFYDHFGFTINDFLKVGVGLWTISSGIKKGRSFQVPPITFLPREIFTQNNNILDVPNFQKIERIIKLFSGYPSDFIQLQKNLPTPDHRLKQYEINLLRLKPIIFPWDFPWNGNYYKAMAILPDLITTLMPDIIYYEMSTKYGKTFLQWFGYLFERYCETALINSIKEKDSFITERQIKKLYSSKDNKPVPDFAIRENGTLILIDSKAARLYRGMIHSVENEEFRKGFENITNGIKQLYDFGKSVLNGEVNIDFFQGVKKFKIMIITLDEFYAINIPIWGRKFLNENYLHDKEPHDWCIHWCILGINQIEYVQPCLNSGMKFTNLIDKIIKFGYKNAIKTLGIGKVIFGDSFLNPYLDQLIESFKPKNN